MKVRLETLVAGVPADTEELVERARQRWNQPIRDALRLETGLRLNRQDAGSGQRPLFDPIAVPIRLEAGLPLTLQKIELDEDDALRLLLARWRGTLGTLEASAGRVQDLIRKLAAEGHLSTVVSGQATHVQAAERLARTLLDMIGKSDPVTKILDVDADVLGAYFFELPANPSLFGLDQPQKVRIELYWGVIGLVAELLNHSVDALTVVVLTHELAHAYTHLGTDIDGHRWSSLAFHQSERGLKEGSSPI